MASQSGTVETVKELLHTIVQFITDESKFSSGNAWKLVSPATLNSGTTEVVVKGVGDDGNDEIFVGLKLEEVDSTQENIVLNGYGEYDPGLPWLEHPAAASNFFEKLPIVPLAKDVSMNYWIRASTSSVIFVVELSAQYEAGYFGFFSPIAIEKQYPYPLLIGGSHVQGGKWTDSTAYHSVFINPAGAGYLANDTFARTYASTDNVPSSLLVRRPDGYWRSAQNANGAGNSLHFSPLCVFPTNVEPKEVYTTYRKNVDALLEDHMLVSLQLYESYPVGILGQLQDIYWVGNAADISAKENIVYMGKTYKVFYNVKDREFDQYFAILWD